MTSRNNVMDFEMNILLKPRRTKNRDGMEYDITTVIKIIICFTSIVPIVKYIIVESRISFSETSKHSRLSD